MREWLRKRREARQVRDTRWVATGSKRTTKEALCHGYYRERTQLEFLAVDICDRRVTKWETDDVKSFDADGNPVKLVYSYNDVFPWC